MSDNLTGRHMCAIIEKFQKVVQSAETEPQLGCARQYYLLARKKVTLPWARFALNIAALELIRKFKEKGYEPIRS